MKYIIENDILNKVEIEDGDTEIVIPDGVKELHKYFFYASFPYEKEEKCKQILRVRIPASLVEINRDVVTNGFDELEKLKEIIVDERNSVYESIDGVLFENHNETKTLIAFPRGSGCKKYAVPEGVTNIRQAAFSNLFDGPFDLKFPKSLKSVDMRCSGIYNQIKRVTIYDNLACDFCEIDFGYYETWFWNVNSMDDLVITVLSAEDDTVKYIIPLMFNVDKTTKAGEACAKAGLAFNPINSGDLSVIDQCYEVFRNKERKLMTAAYRIGWPHMLSPEAKARYEKYLSRYIQDAVEISVEKGYVELIEVFIKNKLIGESEYPQILDPAKGSFLTEEGGPKNCYSTLQTAQNDSSDNNDKREKSKKPVTGTETISETPTKRKKLIDNNKGYSSIYDVYQPSQLLEGKKCCLTGDFAYGSKGKVEKYLTRLGVTLSSSMTKTTQVLIVGSFENADWSHDNYESNVEKALEYRSSGADVIIIRERDLFADDPTFAEKLEMMAAKKTKEAEERKQKAASNEKMNLEQMSVYDAICCLQSEEDCWDFLEELIGLKALQKYEQRAQLANLLDCNATYTEISKKTGASSATISSVNRVFQQNNKFYNNIINNRSNREASTRDYFTRLIVGINNEEECEQFFSCLCSPAECQMMELRFTIAKHLYQGKTYNQVTAETGASSATIGRVKSIIDNDSSLIWDVLRRVDSDELTTAYAEEFAKEKNIEVKAFSGDEERFERAEAAQKIRSKPIANYYTEKTIYEISETIIPDEEPIYILMSGVDVGPKEQYESGYKPASVDELFYNYTIYNGGSEDVYGENFGRIINGISYDLKSILEMITKLQENPPYEDETKYFVVQAGRQLEEYQDMTFGSERQGRMTGKCYIVVSGYCDVVKSMLGVFADLEAAKEYTNFLYSEMEPRIDKIDIIEAEFDKVSSFYNTIDGLDEGMQKMGQVEDYYYENNAFEDDKFAIFVLIENTDYDEGECYKEIKGVSYHLECIEKMISELKAKPETDNNTKYYVYRIEQQLEEIFIPDCEINEPLKENCYLVYRGPIIEIAEEVLGYFENQKDAIQSAEYALDFFETEDINIIRVPLDSLYKLEEVESGCWDEDEGQFIFE